MLSDDTLSPVMHVEEALRESDVDIILHLPCGKIAPLLDVLCENFFNLPLTREEDGVGIAAGASLAGARPLMVIQNSGLGNMVNALMSLTKFYGFPLPVFVSHRGVYKEEIPAQVPMGEHLVDILKAMEVDYVSYNQPEELVDISYQLSDTFSKGKIKCFLFSPKLWEGLPRRPQKPPIRRSCQMNLMKEDTQNPIKRIEALHRLRWYFQDKAVICNMGFPSRELYAVSDQSSNFYMLGSLGLVSSIGLGVSLFTKKEVVVIDGDGSLLMNPNALISIGHIQPWNLNLLCLDNGTYASTGDQVTLSGYGLAMEDLAKASGIGNILVTDNPDSLKKLKGEGPRFVKLTILPGNSDVGTINLSSHEIKNRFQGWLCE